MEHVLVSAAVETDLSACNERGIAAKEDGREIASNITSFCSQQEDHEKASPGIADHRSIFCSTIHYFASYFIPTLDGLALISLLSFSQGPKGKR